MKWHEAKDLALQGQAIRRFLWRVWIEHENGLWFVNDGGARHVVRAADFVLAEYGASDWTTASWENEDAICGRPTPERPSLFPQPTYTFCNVGGGCVSVRAFAKQYGWPTANQGTLPKTFAGDSLEGLTQLGGSDIITVDGYLVREAAIINVNVFDNAMAVLSGLVRSDFEVTYEFYLDSHPGKHWVSVFAKPEANSPFLACGGWELYSGSGEIPLVLLGTSQGVYLQNEQPPPELPAVADLRGVWRRRGVRKAGDTMWLSTDNDEWVPVGRCWFGLRGWIGLQIGPGVRIRNLRVAEFSL